MAPWDMKNVVEKLRDSGSEQILLCERVRVLLQQLSGGI
jgi:3-deoxy-D-manno-octulosonic acid (KDO) 8-phosphate synthase